MDLNYQGKTRSSLHSGSGKIWGLAQGIPGDTASWYFSPTVFIHGKLQSSQGLQSFRNESLVTITHQRSSSPAETLAEKKRDIVWEEGEAR